MSGWRERKTEELRSVSHRQVCVQSRTGRAPLAVIAERDERLGKDRTIGQLMLGEPLPGQSALDKRNKESIHGTN